MTVVEGKSMPEIRCGFVCVVGIGGPAPTAVVAIVYGRA